MCVMCVGAGGLCVPQCLSALWVCAPALGLWRLAELRGSHLCKGFLPAWPHPEIRPPALPSRKRPQDAGVSLRKELSRHGAQRGGSPRPGQEPGPWSWMGSEQGSQPEIFPGHENVGVTQPGAGVTQPGPGVFGIEATQYGLALPQF